MKTVRKRKLILAYIVLAGVPATRVIEESESNNTHDEARVIGRLGLKESLPDPQDSTLSLVLGKLEI